MTMTTSSTADQKVANTKIQDDERAAVAKAYTDPSVTSAQDFFASIRQDLPGRALRTAKAYVTIIRKTDALRNNRREVLYNDLLCSCQEETAAGKAAKDAKEAAEALAQPALPNVTTPTGTAAVPAPTTPDPNWVDAIDDGPADSTPKNSYVSNFSAGSSMAKMGPMKMPPDGRFPITAKDIGTCFGLPTLSVKDLDGLMYRSNTSSLLVMRREVFETLFNMMLQGHTLANAVDLTKTWVKAHNIPTAEATVLPGGASLPAGGTVIHMTVADSFNPVKPAPVGPDQNARVPKHFTRLPNNTGGYYAVDVSRTFHLSYDDVSKAFNGGKLPTTGGEPPCLREPDFNYLFNHMSSGYSFEEACQLTKTNAAFYAATAATAATPKEAANGYVSTFTGREKTAVKKVPRNLPRPVTLKSRYYASDIGVACASGGYPGNMDAAANALSGWRLPFMKDEQGRPYIAEKAFVALFDHMNAGHDFDEACFLVKNGVPTDNLFQRPAIRPHYLGHEIANTFGVNHSLVMSAFKEGLLPTDRKDPHGNPHLKADNFDHLFDRMNAGYSFVAACKSLRVHLGLPDPKAAPVKPVYVMPHPSLIRFTAEDTATVLHVPVNMVRDAFHSGKLPAQLHGNPGNLYLGRASLEAMATHLSAGLLFEAACTATCEALQGPQGVKPTTPPKASVVPAGIDRFYASLTSQVLGQPVSTVFDAFEQGRLPVRDGGRGKFLDRGPLEAMVDFLAAGMSFEEACDATCKVTTLTPTTTSVDIPYVAPKEVPLVSAEHLYAADPAVTVPKTAWEDPSVPNVKGFSLGVPADGDEESSVPADGDEGSPDPVEGLMKAIALGYASHRSWDADDLEIRTRQYTYCGEWETWIAGLGDDQGDHFPRDGAGEPSTRDKTLLGSLTKLANAVSERADEQFQALSKLRELRRPTP